MWSNFHHYTQANKQYHNEDGHDIVASYDVSTIMHDLDIYRGYKSVLLLL